MKDENLDIQYLGLLPIYLEAQRLKKSSIKKYEQYHLLLKENNPLSIYKEYLEFESKMENKNKKDIGYDIFLCEL